MSKGERTKRKILTMAKEHILSKGYTATSIRQIADSVGITPAAIYTHFSGKEEIFTALIEEAAPIDAVLSFLETIQANDADDLIRSTLQHLINLAISHEDYFRLALIDAQERNGVSLSRFLPKVLPAALSYYQRLLSLSDKQSRLRDISPFLFMRGMISLIIGYVMTERIVRSSEALQIPEINWDQGLTNIFMHGVLETS